MNSTWSIKPVYLLFILILSFAISGFFCSSQVFLSSCLYLFLAILILTISKKAAVNWKYLFGSLTNQLNLPQIVLVIPLLGISLAGFYILFYPISRIFPDLFSNILASYSSSESHSYLFKISIQFIAAPIIEEIFFRGFLFTSIASKWGIKNAIIFSSLIFAMFHFEIIGGFIFGATLAIIYSTSKTLYLPILIHSCYNILTSFTDIIYLKLHNTQFDYNISTFQNEWYLGLIGFVIGAPWLIIFFIKEIKKGTKIPYFANYSRYQQGG